MGRLISIGDVIELKKGARGSIKNKSGSKMLYVDFAYLGERLERSSGIPDTPKNRTLLREWLDRQMDKIDMGTFVFAEAFPNASDEEKRYFAKLEGRVYHSDPRDVIFGDYVAHWKDKVLSRYSVEKRRDFLGTIDYWLLPYWGHISFYGITNVELQGFISELKWRDGKNKGRQLSKSRIKNVMIPLRTIWYDACSENHWILPSPFENIKKHMPESVTQQPEVYSFDEWMGIVTNFDPFYRSTIESAVMTGMIASELAGLRKTDVGEDHITIQNSIVKGNEKEKLKTRYRKRKLPITKALRPLLDDAMSRSDSKYVFTMKNGGTFDIKAFGREWGVWAKAQKLAGVPYRSTYSIRHTFCAWAYTLGMDPGKLEKLMGHGSKAMIYEVYGKYKEGQEKDKERILGYFGEDFL
jgi:integrase